MHPPHADVVRGKGENAGERFAKLPGSDRCDCFRGGSTLLGVGLQVWILEQQNQVLGTKWELLQQLDLNNCKNNLEPILEGCTSNLRKQLETLSGGRMSLDSDLRNVWDVVEDYKKR